MLTYHRWYSITIQANAYRFDSSARVRVSVCLWVSKKCAWWSVIVCERMVCTKEVCKTDVNRMESPTFTMKWYNIFIFTQKHRHTQTHLSLNIHTCAVRFHPMHTSLKFYFFRRRKKKPHHVIFIWFIYQSVPTQSRLHVISLIKNTHTHIYDKYACWLVFFFFRLRQFWNTTWVVKYHDTMVKMNRNNFGPKKKKNASVQLS